MWGSLAVWQAAADCQSANCCVRTESAAIARCGDTWAMLELERMDPIIRKYTSFDEMKADEYRYWQSRPAHERIDAVEEMIETAYALKGWELEPDVPRLQRPFVRLPCPWR